MIVDRGAVAAALEKWNGRRRRIFYPKTDLDFDLAARRRRKQELGASNLDWLSELLDGPEAQFLPGAGTLHAIFRVLATEGPHFLKLGLEESDPGFSIEAWALARLCGLGLPSPSVQFQMLGGLDRPPYFLAPEAAGKTLRSLENPETQALPEPLLFTFGSLLARIHQIPCSGAGLLDVSTLDFGSLATAPRGLQPDWPNHFALRLDEHLRACLQIRAITGMELSEIEGHFAEAGPLLDSAPIRLLHGDPGHHNAFSDGSAITALIDWEDALAGDPVFDIAYWGTFVRDEMRDRFLEGYQSIQALPPDFERRYWLYYLRIAISKTVHRHLFGVQDCPGRPPASRRIQKALSNLPNL